MPQYTALELIKVLRTHGFCLARQKGSHQIYKDPKGLLVTVPFHGKSKTVPLGTALAIIKQSQIPKEQF